MRRLAAFLRLDAADRAIVVCALGALPAIALLLRFAGLRRAQDLLARPASGHDRERASRIAGLVAAVARHGPYRSTCLPIALATQWLLAREGIAAELKLGVRKVEGRLDAHAWIEHGGAALGDTPGGEPFAALAP